MGKIKAIVISANLGGIDNTINFNPVEQDTGGILSIEYVRLNDSNYPIREKALHPRLQAKIPKMLGYELYPGYDYYIWIDGNFNFEHSHCVLNFIENCKNYDASFFLHPWRSKVGEEFDFMFAHTNTHPYLNNRYKNEFFVEQYNLYNSIDNFYDQPLYACGAFIYNKSIIDKQSPNILEQWYYHNCRYSVQDQLSLPYLLLKNKGVYNINILEGDLTNKNKYVSYLGGHT